MQHNTVHHPYFPITQDHCRAIRYDASITRILRGSYVGTPRIYTVTEYTISSPLSPIHSSVSFYRQYVRFELKSHRVRTYCYVNFNIHNSGRSSGNRGDCVS